MKAITRKIISISMIMLMIMPLTWQVYADDVSPEEHGTEAVQIEDVQSVHESSETAEPSGQAGPEAEPVSEVSESAGAEEGSAPEVSEPAEAEEKTVSEVSEPDGAEEKSATDVSEPAEEAEEPAPAVIVPSGFAVSSAQAASAKAEPQNDTINAGSEQTEPAAQETADTSDASEAEANTGESEIEKNITIAGTKLDGSKDGSGSGWSYDKASGTIVLRDFNSKADITSDGTAVKIVASGLNRIGKLSIDGQLDIIGSGIMLVESIELAEGCDLNLLHVKAMYGEENSGVAVFLKQDDGSYMLINGEVKGIIDEAIDLTDGTALVIPENSTLELKAIVRKTTFDEQWNIINEEFGDFDIHTHEPFQEVDLLAGDLKVSKLIVETGAMVINLSMGSTLAAELTVKDMLVNNGTVSGDSTYGIINIDGDYSGDGLLGGTVFVNKEQTNSYNLANGTRLFLSGKHTITSLTAGGRADLYYDGDTIVNKIELPKNKSIVIYSRNNLSDVNTIKLTGPASAGEIEIASGSAELSEEYEGPVPSVNGSVLFNYSSVAHYSDGTGGPVFTDPKNAALLLKDQNGQIPVVSLNFHYTVSIRDGYRYYVFKENPFGDQYEELAPYIDGSSEELDPNIDGSAESREITFDDLYDAYLKGEKRSGFAFEVFRYDGSRLSMTVLSDDKEWTVPSDGVFLIRLVSISGDETHEGGSSSTSTLASRTGAATIGGNPKSVLKGTGITRTKPAEPDESDPVKPDTDDEDDSKPDTVDPDPVKPDPVKPDPVKPDPVDPDPVKPDPVDPDPVKPDPVDPDPVKPDPVDPDPVKPVKPDDKDTARTIKEYAVAAVTSAGDTLAILVNEFDLNEGSDEDAEIVPYYNLTAYINGAQISELNGSVEVVMYYVLPEELKDKPLYAVFANEDEASDEVLKAVRAEYSEEDGTITFETSQLGEFVITAFEFDGEEFSPEFYDELGKTEIVKLFVEHLKEKNDDAEL